MMKKKKKNKNKKKKMMMMTTIIITMTRVVIMMVTMGGCCLQVPHVYSVGAYAFSAMISQHKNQSVLISGESGAGTQAVSSMFIEWSAAEVLNTTSFLGKE